MENEQLIKNLILVNYPTAVKSGQAENYQALFADKVTYIPDGAPQFNSNAEVGAFYSQMSSKFKIDPELEINELKILDSGMDAIVVGKSHANLIPLDGSESSLHHFRLFWILTKETGEWKIAKQIWNTEPQG